MNHYKSAGIGKQGWLAFLTLDPRPPPPPPTDLLADPQQPGQHQLRYAGLEQGRCQQLLVAAAGLLPHVARMSVGGVISIQPLDGSYGPRSGERDDQELPKR